MHRLNELWSQLERSAGAGPGFRRIRYSNDQPGEVYLGLKTPERHRVLALRLPRSFAAGLKTLPQLGGLRLEKVADPDDAGRFLLNLVLTERAFADVFDVLLGDLVEVLVGLDQPPALLRTFLEKLAQWQALFEGFAAEGLSPERQRGLFGEIIMLRRLLDGGADPLGMVQSWVGSQAAPQDFQGADWALEVKTSLGATHPSFTVSNERQLDETTWSGLFLVHLALETRTGGGQTLNEAVGVIRAALDGYTFARQEFNRRLIAAGYFETHAERYETPGYLVRGEHRFRVAGAFPRLRVADLPPGVGEVRYTVQLAACLPFAISETELLQFLR
jgi:hypothetical protein